MSGADLSYAAVLDTSEYDSACDHIVGKTSEASNQIASESEKIQSLLTNIPKVNLDFLQNIEDVEEMREGVGQAFAQIHRVIRENSEALVELNQMYNEASDEAYKFANVPSMQEHYQELKQQKAAIKEVIQARKQAIAAAKEAETSLENETKSLIKSAEAKQKNGKQTQTLKQRIKELENEAAMLVNTAQQEGRVLDQSTGRYREIIEELGRLRDIRGDIQTAGNVFANDEANIAGVIQGLSGLSGAFTVAQGAIGLFGSENERLNEIMLKVQSLMAITMGLQQVQQVLNKDSTFSLITLNAIKKLFNKNSEEAAEVLSEENAEIADNIKETKEEILTQEAAEATEQADTIATEENTAATRGNAASQGQQAAANEGATATQNAHTGSMVAGTIATKTLTAATKLLKLALISTGIGALVVLVGELVSWVTQLFSSEEEATKEAKALADAHEKGAETYAKTSTEINGYINKLNTFNGSKKQEKLLLKEINDKYGEQLGYASSISEAKDILTKKAKTYCEMLQYEAEAQALLNEAAAAYVEIQRVQHKADQGEFDDHLYEFWNWGGKSSQDKRDEAVNDAKSYYESILAEYQKVSAKASQIRIDNDFGGFTDPTAKTIKGSGSGKTYDPQKAAADFKKLQEDFAEKVKQYLKQTNDAISQAMIDGMEDGYYKEINAMHKQMQDRKRAWQQSLIDLAIAKRDSTKAAYMLQQGATEKGWADSANGKKSVQDWVNEMLQDDSVRTNYEQGLTDIDEALNRGLADIRDKYMRQLINDFGTYNQKFDQLSVDWQKKIGFISSAFPDFLPEALRKMEEEFSALKSEDFKKSINWDDVFGNLGEQSLQSLQFSLDKVKQYFKANSKDMTVEQIKTYKEAIDSMENEIASRNSFTAMHKSFTDIADAKTELVTSLEELAAAQRKLTAAQNDYNDAFRVENDLRGKVINADRGDETDALIKKQHEVLKAEEDYQTALANRNNIQTQVESGELDADNKEVIDAQSALNKAEQVRNDLLAERATLMNNMNDADLAQTCLDLASAQDRLNKSTSTLAQSQQRNTEAEQNTLTARNKVTKSYKTFATNLNAAGKVTTDVGKKASNLARVFSDDIADGMDKALDFIDEVLDATTDVISAIGDVGKTVAKDTAQVADAAGQATKSTAQATATSISTVEKASVILTVISAALQIATAIANLFNNDDAKQKEIERLQERIDQLQWELDNQEAVELQKKYGNALAKVREMYAKARQEVLALHGVTQNAIQWKKWLTAVRHQAEIYEKTVEKLADYWANVDYQTGKALGSARYDNARDQLKNLAEQQVLLQQMIDKENSKKKKKIDSGKIQDLKNEMNEIAAEMAALINEMLEDIIGYTAEDISKTLGDAFVEAAKAGEDAMKAWGDTVNDIVSDILKKMMIQQIIEPAIGKIFDKYKAKWFPNGEFGPDGFKNVKNSMNEFANDINAIASGFQTAMDEMPEELKQFLLGDEERSGTERGIATASQDSVDENNARLTTIQSHTYTLVQMQSEINETSTQILVHVANIDSTTKKTADDVEDMKEDVKRTRNTLEDITTQGIKLKP